MIALDDFCAYARIDVQDDAATLNHLLTAAETMVRDSTGKRRPDGGNDSIYDIAVMMLAAHWYDNRTPTGTETKEIPYSLSLLINHIALCSTYPEVREIEPYK